LKPQVFKPRRVAESLRRITANASHESASRAYAVGAVRELIYQGIENVLRFGMATGKKQCPRVPLAMADIRQFVGRSALKPVRNTIGNTLGLSRVPIST
jgi:hypothetical protein